jgi:transcriptional regulator with XRE-family HTH domain
MPQNKHDEDHGDYFGWVGERVARARMLRGMSQRAVARSARRQVTRVSSTTVSHLESGARREVQMSTLLALSEVLSVVFLVVPYNVEPGTIPLVKGMTTIIEIDEPTKTVTVRVK